MPARSFEDIIGRLSRLKNFCLLYPLNPLNLRLLNLRWISTVG